MQAPVISYVIDPRFPGGTSTAVASELAAVAGLGHVRVHAVESAMFSGRTVAPQLAVAFDELGLRPDWDSPVIGGDLVLLHNPAFLKFQPTLGRRIVARHLIVISHENFLRGGVAESFDVAGCLNAIDRATFAMTKSVAPVSQANRGTVEAWDRRFGLPEGWTIFGETWHDICDLPLAAPTPAPRDRRGRHSRPGFEKFPGLEALDLCFPAHAEANVILGADALIARELDRPHWTLHPFRGIDLADYFGQIDFMVYFTSPTWQESFGLAIAEAIAAGKVVITDAATAATFGNGVIAARPDEVDAIVARLIAEPALYGAQVQRGQARLADFSAAKARERVQALIGRRELAA